MSLIIARDKRIELSMGLGNPSMLFTTASSTIYTAQIVQEMMTLGESRSGIASSSATVPVRMRDLIELELSGLIVYTHSLITDPERFRRLTELFGDRWVLHIIWLVNMPFDALSDRYRGVELQLFRLVRYRSDVSVVILDATKFPNIVVGIMIAFGIEELPALIISEKPVDIGNPDARDTVVLGKGAIDRLIERGKVQDFLANLPIWAAQGNLRSRARFEGVVKPLLGELWDEIKGLIKLNIPV